MCAALEASICSHSAARQRPVSLLVRVWIEDLLCWLQSLPDAAAEQLLSAIAAVVEATRVSKRDLGFAALQQPE